MNRKNNPILFAVTFVILFLLFYFFNIIFFGLTTPGKNYSAFLTNHCNYIQGLRWLLLFCTSQLLKVLGYAAVFNNYELLVAGHGTIQVVYTCLGLGILSFFCAFIIAYPKPLKAKVTALVLGSLAIEFLNIIRFILIALFGNKKNNLLIDHHTLFNIIMYAILAISLYFWIVKDIKVKLQQ